MTHRYRPGSVRGRGSRGRTAHLFAVLRDDAITATSPADEDESQIEFCMSWHQVANGLDVLGIDEATVLEVLTEAIATRRRGPLT
jgi:hypothetical protein